MNEAPAVVRDDTAKDFPLSDVTSVAWQPEVMLGAVVISTAAGKTEINDVDNNDGKDLVDIVRAGLVAPGPTSPVPPAATSLEQLAAILGAL